MLSSTTSEQILKNWTLSSRNYVVTGGTNGIGLATVKVRKILTKVQRERNDSTFFLEGFKSESFFLIPPFFLPIAK